MGRWTPMFDPRDVKVATLQATIVAGAASAFPAPGNAIATRHRYLLAWAITNISSGTVRAFTLEDQNGNDLITCAPFLCEKFVLKQPLAVGVPNANGLQVRNVFGVDCAVSSWVCFADVQAAIVPAFAVTI